jgi:general secretion pathway protein E
MNESPPSELAGRLASVPETDDWGVQVAEHLLRWAEVAGASDLHVQSQRDRLVVRMRAEGILATIASFTTPRRELLVARLKVLARCAAFVRNQPQDGRIERRAPDGSSVALRLSTLPSLHGESLVVRFPEPTHVPSSLEGLGLREGMLAAVRRLLALPEGTVLVTGPSGSGKTTTLYALLREIHLDRGERIHAVTIEDPVERDLGFGVQVGVNEAQELTFDRALRSALRQDPNVLLIGEVRDSETAKICVQAGMTGHLVLSTLHAGRVARVPGRLLSMGVEPYLVASALTGMLAQRLARTLCTDCGGDGCDACHGTGERGRTALFELGRVEEQLREQILRREGAERLADTVRLRQISSLAAEARLLFDQGRISQRELGILLAEEAEG